METIEQKISLSQEQAQKQTSEQKEVRNASDAVKGFEDQMLTLQRAIAETDELAKKDPEKAAAQKKDLEMHAAGLWLNVRMAQASRVRLGDTPQEIGKNSERLNDIAEKLGRPIIDACVYYIEKILPEFTRAAGAIEEAWLEKKSTALEAVEERRKLSERLNDFIERKIYLVREMLNDRELKKMPKEEKDALTARVQRVENKALSMCRELDAPLETPQEKTEKK